jgi:hypothetical protein
LWRPWLAQWKYPQGVKSQSPLAVVYLNETIAFYVVLGSQTRRSFANEIANELRSTGQGVTLVPLRGTAPGRGNCISTLARVR